MVAVLFGFFRFFSCFGVVFLEESGVATDSDYRFNLKYGNNKGYNTHSKDCL